MAMTRFVGGPWDGQSRDVGNAPSLKLPVRNPKAESGYWISHSMNLNAKPTFIVVEYIRTDEHTMTCVTAG
jgi:hypothetical protein